MSYPRPLSATLGQAPSLGTARVIASIHAALEQPPVDTTAGAADSTVPKQKKAEASLKNEESFNQSIWNVDPDAAEDTPREEAAGAAEGKKKSYPRNPYAQTPSQIIRSRCGTIRALLMAGLLRHTDLIPVQPQAVSDHAADEAGDGVGSSSSLPSVMKLDVKSLPPPVYPAPTLALRPPSRTSMSPVVAPTASQPQNPQQLQQQFQQRMLGASTGISYPQTTAAPSSTATVATAPSGSVNNTPLHSPFFQPPQSMSQPVTAIQTNQGSLSGAQYALANPQAVSQSAPVGLVTHGNNQTPTAAQLFAPTPVFQTSQSSTTPAVNPPSIVPIASSSQSLPSGIQSQQQIQQQMLQPQVPLLNRSNSGQATYSLPGLSSVYNVPQLAPQPPVMTIQQQQQLLLQQNSLVQQQQQYIQSRQQQLQQISLAAQIDSVRTHAASQPENVLTLQQLQQLQLQQQLMAQDHLKQRNQLIQQLQLQQQQLQLRVHQTPHHLLPELTRQLQIQVQSQQQQIQQLQAQLQQRQMQQQQQQQMVDVPQVSQSASVVAVRSIMSLSPTPSGLPPTAPLPLPYSRPQQAPAYGNINGNGYMLASPHSSQSSPSSRNMNMSNNGLSVSGGSAATPTAAPSTAVPVVKGAAASAAKKEYWLGWLQTEERCASVAARGMDHYARILVSVICQFIVYTAILFNITSLIIILIFSQLNYSL